MRQSGHAAANRCGGSVRDPELGVCARGVRRRFGTVRALSGLDLTAPYGQVTALIGPNGSGKTTLLLVLATLLAADAGEVRVAGADPRTDAAAVRAATGWLPETSGVYERLRVREYLEFFGAAHGLPRPQAVRRSAELLELVHLAEFAAKPAAVLTRGQRRRLGLARALVHRPSVLLLDEPAAGLDPRSRAQLRSLLRQLAADGAAVLVSSHVLAELEDVADRAVFVRNGTTAGARDIAGHAAYARRPWRIRATDPAALSAALKHRRIASAAVTGGAEVTLGSDEEAAGLLAALVGGGIRVLTFAPAGGSLETAYRELAQERP
jgi:ABC-2 type transport system ATP-binding protein